MAVLPPIFFVAIALILVGAVVLLWLDRARLKQAAATKDAMIKPAESLASTFETKVVSPEELEYLREELSSFHQAVAQCPSSIIICDVDGAIQYVNAQFTRSSGYGMEEVVGRNPRFLKSGNMDPAVYEDLWKTISSGNVWRGDLENRNKNGQVFWELTSISPIKNNDGEILRYFAIKEDITEIRLLGMASRQARLEAAGAEEADHAKGVFLKAIGQEMKNPIDRILGFTNLISQSKLTKDQLQQLNQVGAAGLELLSLIDRILDFTSIETGTMELDYAPFKPVEVVEQLVKSYEPKASERNVVIHRHISKAIPETVIGDEKRFRDVLKPLLDNAVKFTDEGSVTVSLNAAYNDENQVWEFSGKVSDTGNGIPPENLGVLFKPFAQLEHGQGDGTGLGLALCQRLCTLQGGLLTAESEYGTGSTFAFNLKFLPLDKEATVAPTIEIPDGEAFAESYPVDILIAEDNRINRRLLETLMQRLGYQATFALDGTSVMTEVLKRSYDLILMDLQMPLMGGIETTRRIRSGEAGEAVKQARIVAITAFISDENLQASKEVGMDALLAKPFDISKIKMEIIHAYKDKLAQKA